MNQINAEVIVSNQDEETQGLNPEEGRMLDYDDQPYGDDNILIRASKRRAFLYSASQL